MFTCTCMSRVLTINQKFKIELYYKFVSLKKNPFFLHLKVRQSHQIDVH